MHLLIQFVFKEYIYKILENYYIETVYFVCSKCWIWTASLYIW